MKRMISLFFLSICAGCTFRAVAGPTESGRPTQVAAPAPAPAPAQPTGWVATPPVIHRTPSEPVAAPPLQPAPAPATPVVVAGPSATPAVASDSEKRDRQLDRKFDRRSDWDKLGERWVEGAVDRDTIAVGQRDGAFVALSIVVEHSALEVFGIVVEFADGSTFSPDLRAVFRPGSTSHVFDLPGGARFVRRVSFQYGNLPGGGRAQLELWGLDARRDSGDRHDGRQGHDGRDGREGDRPGRGHGRRN